MISKEQLNNIAQKTGLDLYQQEKDYMLKLFLYLYYKNYEDAIFKGGTCLKYILGLQRFSEDIDFNIKNPKKFKEQVKKVIDKINQFGIKAYFIKEKIFDESYTCEIGFHGPLYKGSSQTQNKFRIDAGYREGTVIKPEWNMIKSEYPETEDSFLVLNMSLEEIFVEKIIALMTRKKGRDLYDLWFLIKTGVKLNKQLLKTKSEKIDITNLDFKIIITKKEYERDISRLTNRIIPYEDIKKEIVRLLE